MNEKDGFIVEVLHRIGSYIANTQEEEKKEEEEKMSKIETSIMDQDKYYVYAHLNSPIEEDYVFLLTALFNWSKTHPDKTNDILVKDYELICIKDGKI